MGFLRVLPEGESEVRVTCGFVLHVRRHFIVATQELSGFIRHGEIDVRGEIFVRFQECTDRADQATIVTFERGAGDDIALEYARGLDQRVQTEKTSEGVPD